MLAVSGTYATSESLSAIDAKVTANSASIASQATLIQGNLSSIASISQTVNSQGANIALVVENGSIKGGAVISAINGETTAKISADRLEIDGKTLNIKVDATNIVGELTIGQLPSFVATTSDIPTAVSELTNDSGYKTYSGVVSIIDGRITADYIEALGVTANSLQIVDSRGNNLLYAKNQSVEIAGWGVNADSFSTSYSGYVGETYVNSVMNLFSASSDSDFWLESWDYASQSGVSLGKNGLFTADNAEIRGSITSTSGNYTFEIKNGSAISSAYGYETLFSQLGFATSYGFNGLFRCGISDDESTGIVLGPGNSNIYFYSTYSNLTGTWRLNSNTAITSDYNMKHDIVAPSDKYDVFFDALLPVMYKYNDGTSDRYHSGFIANAVADALALAEIETKDFAGYVLVDEKDEDGNSKKTACLRYGEFVSLNTWQIQRLKTRVQALEEIISNMEV